MKRGNTMFFYVVAITISFAALAAVSEFIYHYYIW